MSDTFKNPFHIPVLSDKILSIASQYISFDEVIILDATLGEGGYADSFFKGFPKKISLYVGLDLDLHILKLAKTRLSNLSNIYFVCMNFKDMDALKITPNIIIMDLGISTYHYFSGRGFSFKDTSSLDMRYNTFTGEKAIDFIKRTSFLELSSILREYADERFAERIAKAIVSNRKNIATSYDLRKVVLSSLPKKYIQSLRIDPATKTFMAIRIAVNKELDNLKLGIVSALKILSFKGLLFVLSYHSKEDRIVKEKFREYESLGVGKSLFKKPIVPERDEIRKNPSSRSAKMRIFMKY